MTVPPARHHPLRSWTILALAVLPPLLAACGDASRQVLERELASAQGRFRMGVGDLGPARDEATARATALPEAARRHQPGDRFLYSNGRIAEVIEAEGVVVVWDEGGGQGAAATINPAFPAFSSSSARFTRTTRLGGDPPEGLWPLGGPPQAYNAVTTRTEPATGEERSFRSRRECVAEPPASVETPHGPYMAIPIVCRHFSGRRLNQSATLRWDMVPALGHWVRHVETDQRGQIRREVYLEAIEPGPWLGEAARRRLGQSLRQALERQPSGTVIGFEDRAAGLHGYLMVTATFVETAAGERFCRGYTLTIARSGAKADGAPTDYPGSSCRIDGAWKLPAGF